MSDTETLIEVGVDLHRTREETWGALLRCNEPKAPRVMRRGGQLVRINRETNLIQPYTQASLLDRMSECAGFCKPKKTDDERPSMIRAPKDIPPLILASDDIREAPQVDGVAKMPFLGRDMKLHTEPGYHSAERIWLTPDIDVPPVPANPSPEDVAVAVELLMDDWLGDFSFADEASRANALALALLPFVRPAIAEATPLHIVNAASPGAGKSTLTKAALLPGVGHFSLVALERWSSEMKREVTSWLLEGKPVICFDNQRGGSRVDSALLSALVTEPSYSGRIMGQTATPDSTIRCVWVMTGNNLSFSDELARRGVLIQLDEPTKGEDEYRHNPLVDWTEQKRAAIAYALLTLVQHWAAGVPEYEHGIASEDRTAERHGPARMKKTFEQWATVVGGILRAAGVDGFLENERKMKERDSESRDVESFLQAISEATDGATFLITDLVGLGKGDLQSSLPPELSGEKEDLHKLLQVWLRSNKDRWWGSYRLVATNERSPIKWRVERRG
jgi:hypothetical protein